MRFLHLCMPPASYGSTDHIFIHDDEPAGVRQGGRQCQDDEFRQKPCTYDAAWMTKKLLFQNVAGLQEEKEDLVEVVDFLKAPQKYTSVGATYPQGCPSCRTSGNR